MKNYIKIFALAIGVMFVGTAMAQPQTPAQKLLKRLVKLQKRGVMIGHQDDPMYGTTWSWDQNRSDVKEITGDYPAIMGFDLGELELGHDKNLDQVPFQRMRIEAVRHAMRGGIITISWHPHNPVTGGTAWDPSGEPVKKILVPGVAHDKFVAWVKGVADFINTFRTTKGQKVPVIFRPWHEMNGGWFWWGKDSCTPEEYKQFYVLTYNLMRQYGCTDNIVWAWSPNLAGNDSEEKLMTCYPGGQYVDLIGIDLYEFGGSETTYQQNLKAELNILVSAAEKQGKVAALTETGFRGCGEQTSLFMQTLLPVLNSYQKRLSYALFWRNDYVKPAQEAYLPGIGSKAAPDFKSFCDQKNILMLGDIE